MRAWSPSRNRTPSPAPTTSSTPSGKRHARAHTEALENPLGRASVRLGCRYLSAPTPNTHGGVRSSSTDIQQRLTHPPPHTVAGAVACPASGAGITESDPSPLLAPGRRALLPRLSRTSALDRLRHGASLPELAEAKSGGPDADGRSRQDLPPASNLIFRRHRASLVYNTAPFGKPLRRRYC
jgi:hypothetical protein